MLRFLIAIISNLKRGPKLISTMRKMAKNKEKYSEKQRYAYAQRLFRLLMRSARISTTVYGADNLPREGGYVMYPNHQGKYDALGIMYGHKEPCTFVMDKAKSFGFMVREVCDLLDAKRLRLGNVRQNMKIMDQITKEVSKGRKYILFSEGGYGKNGNVVQNFKPGSFKCAMRAKVPIVPVTLIDSYIAFNSLKPGPVSTKVIFGNPIYYDDYKDMKTPEIADMVRKIIISTMEEYGVFDNSRIQLETIE
ncbi:lysophospholipid acyltransferase family protein [Pseudobutyrivibrio xylanivorans]|uniref:1-acyl-sn-glycerol-3-phosphate acyltransferase n=1 Tax=Pseudobutyrivibrio xylanivorans TaxID=185007 RepID=A0A5P6VSD6_PSEXY|nr:lysophospholipid acyltransferase family protein [Pseudobutyrivibrio xylanivorans]QFJ55615.1 1-acyl-sn-glycerol-3-phosphate acyltransferase [Pseudobutyrivibrio xylanivorans]